MPVTVLAGSGRAPARFTAADQHSSRDALRCVGLALREANLDAIVGALSEVKFAEISAHSLLPYRRPGEPTL